MIVALTPMVVLSGFRRASHVAADLAAVGGATALRLADLLATGGSGPVGLAAYLRTVLTDPSVRDIIPDIAMAGTASGASPGLAVAAAAAEQFPGDPGVLVAPALNTVPLAPGEACFTPDGIVHSYQSGLGLEIMANSDNVIRAGLTPKHVDVPALLDVARTAPESPHRPREVEEGSTVTYIAAAREFRLVIVQNGAATFPSGPRMVLALDGASSAHAGGTGRMLERGAALFVADAEGPLEVETSGQAAVAFVPSNGT
jgi:mannose-6-phosphate isomerase